jgi:hypothetical protein
VLKMLHFDHGYVTRLYVPIYLVGDACTKFVAILLVYVSFLACCSALCLFEAHMLKFVDWIHALPTRGRKVLNSCIQGEFCTKGKKKIYRLPSPLWSPNRSFTLAERLERSHLLHPVRIEVLPMVDQHHLDESPCRHEKSP